MSNENERISYSNAKKAFKKAGVIFIHELMETRPSVFEMVEYPLLIPTKEPEPGAIYPGTLRNRSQDSEE
jgi:hypothetical protein